MPYQPPAIPRPRFIAMLRSSPLARQISLCSRINHVARSQRAGRTGPLTAQIRTRCAAHIRDTAFPPRRGARGLENLRHAGRIERLLGMSLIALAHRIFKTQFERVHAQPLGAYVEMGLGRELGLQRAERPKRARRRIVRIDAIVVDLEIRDIEVAAPEGRPLPKNSFGRHTAASAVVTMSD